MESAKAIFFLAVVILGVKSAPLSTNGGDGVGENQGEVPLEIDDSFYQEFPEVVDPSANSKFLEHIEDMVFIKEDKNITRSKRNAVFYRDHIWPGGIVPYEISSSYDDFEKRVIYQAMVHWEENTCIRFRPKVSSDRYSIYINNTRPYDCSSFVGRIIFRFPRKQVVSLGDDCVYFSTAVHELGHAIGLYHEHNRADRDDYLTVYPERYFYPSQIKKQSRSNTLGLGYDYASIMHYGRSSRGALNSKIGAPFGNAEELSPLDIAKVNRLYGCGSCDNRPPLRTTVPPLTKPGGGSCGQLIQTSQSGVFTFPSFPPNTKCNFVLAVPKGFGVQYHVQLLGGNLDSSSNCDNSYIAFYEGATVASHRIYGYRPKPRFCKRNEFYSTFILPSNVTTISYQSGSTGSKSIRVNYYLEDLNECRRARSCKSCVNTRGSYSCTCNTGFYLSEPARTCFDVNECAYDNGGCEHTCTNTAGSYSCSCRSGYFLQADGKSCGTRRPSSTPWKLVPGTLNTSSCPVSFAVLDQPPAVTTPKPTTLLPTTIPTTLPPTTVPTTTKAPATTPSPPPTTPTSSKETINVVSSTMNNYDTLFNTPGWPNEVYPLNKNFEWHLKCPEGTDFIDIKFEETFLVAGKMPQCPKAQVYVYSDRIKVGGPYCHITAPEPIQSLSATNTKVTFSSGTSRGYTRFGFGVRYQCRGSPPTLPPPTTERPTTLRPTQPPTTTDFPTTTMAPTTRRPTTLPPTTPRPTVPTTTKASATTPSSPPTIPPSSSKETINVISSTMNNFNTLFSTPGWPNEVYPLNKNFEWQLKCPEGTDFIDIRFEETFLVAGKMPQCPKAQVYVYSNGIKVGGPYCHITAPEPIQSLSTTNTKVTFSSGTSRGNTRFGFGVRYQCRGSPPTLPPPTTERPTTPRPTQPPTTTAPPTTTMAPTTHRPTTLPPTTPMPTTAAPTTIIPTTTNNPPSPSGSCGGGILALATNVYYYFSTPGWPDEPYPLNINCEWLIFCPSSSTRVEISFDENFKVAGKMPTCPKDKVYVESNGIKQGPFCHITRPETIVAFYSGSTKVVFQAGEGRGITRTGFRVQFRCR